MMPANQFEREALQALSDAWRDFSVPHGMPSTYDGIPTLEMIDAIECVQQALREHIVATGNNHLYSLLQLLGNASLRMEQVFDSENFERINRQIQSSLDSNEENSQHTRHLGRPHD